FATDATVTASIYPLSLHDALPISGEGGGGAGDAGGRDGERHTHAGERRQPSVHRAAHDRAWASRGGVPADQGRTGASGGSAGRRSEEHTSELQSRENLVCRLLLEK